MSWRARLAAEIVARSGVTADAFVQRVAPLVDASAVAAFEAELGVESVAAGSESLDALVPPAERAAHGVYFTPDGVCERLVAHLDPELAGAVVDLACGDGAILVAAARRCPEASLVGVEREPLFAVAAAANLWRVRGGHPRDGDFVHCGDGLAEHPHITGAAAVVGNPPYVGEKGNRALFRQVRDAHPHLEPWFGPRIDLHYLFLHRAVECLRPGGTLVQLTSEYWLTATGARHLRRHLAEATTVEALDRLGLGAFEAAPGHHSLILVATRGGPTHNPRLPADGTWHPFARTAPLQGIPFADVCRDRQGFVSGLDRVTARHAAALQRPAGDPVFLWRTDELPDDAQHLFEPVLRRADCVANRVFVEPPAREHVLWVDDALPDGERERVEALLEPFRSVLERRREVQKGMMPWTRIWWPRNAEEYRRPKLVVPRRATDAAFCLDLSGSFISSDCTFILCDPELDAVPSLLAVMLVANHRNSLEHLRQYGKTKGAIIEFYSAPLRRLPLQVERRGHRLVPVDPGLRARWEAGLGKLDTITSHFDV